MKKFKWWWAWNAHKFENYLERMAAKGYELEEVKYSMTWLTFEKGEPNKVRYCTDFQTKDSEEYRMIIADDGWKLVGESGAWKLWAKSYKEQRPDLYTDTKDIVSRNNRLLLVLALVLLMQLPMWMNNPLRFFELQNGLSIAFSIFYWLIIATCLYGGLCMLRQNNRLRKYRE